jgi:hypothetical protein
MGEFGNGVVSGQFVYTSKGNADVPVHYFGHAELNFIIETLKRR